MKSRPKPPQGTLNSLKALLVLHSSPYLVLPSAHWTLLSSRVRPWSRPENCPSFVLGTEPRQDVSGRPSTRRVQYGYEGCSSRLRPSEEETLRHWRGPVSWTFAARSRPGVHGCLPQGLGIRDEIHRLLAQHARCQDLEAVGPGEKIPLTKQERGWYGISFRKLPPAVSAF